MNLFYKKLSSLFFFTLVFSILYSLSSFAQTAPEIEWQKAFGGNDDDNLSVMQKTSDGGFILGGTSKSGKTGSKESNIGEDKSDYWIVKIDACGNKQWEQSYNLKYDELTCIDTIAGGGYYLGGTMHNTEKSGQERLYSYWILRIDLIGNILWSKTYNAGGNLSSLQTTFDGGAIIGGNVREVEDTAYVFDVSDTLYGFLDYWVLKIDAYGNKQWDRTFGGEGSDRAPVVRQLSDGSFVALGTSASTNLSNAKGNKTSRFYGGLPVDYGTYGDLWLVKMDLFGNKLWDQSYGGDGWDLTLKLSTNNPGQLITQTNDGKYLIGGMSFSKPFTFKYANGATFAVKKDSSKGDFDFWLAMIDPVQAAASSASKSPDIPLWDKTYGAAGDSTIKDGAYDAKFDMSAADELVWIEHTSDGGYILGGNSPSRNNGDKSDDTRGKNDYWIIKIDANGAKQWDKTIGGEANDYLMTVKETSDGGYLLAGISSSQKAGYGPGVGDKTVESFSASSSAWGVSNDYWIVKLKGVDASTPAVAGFNVPTKLCTNTPIYFQDASANTSVWQWDFSDGLSATTKNAVHTFKTSGTYTISLGVGSKCGTVDDTHSEIIDVLASPIVNLGLDVFIENGESTTLDAGVDNVTYVWSPTGETSKTIGITSAQASSLNNVFSVLVTNAAGCSQSDTVNVFVAGVGIDELNYKSSYQVYPNPFKDQTTISYYLNKKSEINLELYSLLGEKVLDIYNGVQPEGDYNITFNSSDTNLPSGIYLLYLKVDHAQSTKRLIKLAD